MPFLVYKENHMRALAVKLRTAQVFFYGSVFGLFRQIGLTVDVGWF
jgi:hypothetical protein